ncbi:class I SAM-dependent methyltransferase [Ekhidna sp.]|uniref:class I SAM-dependent methyltransferase n=1 Tax=Ekhidna sp. TaxID=2608089 RepID=UPI0032975347
MAVNDFNFIATFYDELAKLVFGKSLLKAQLVHLQNIRDTDHVLIIGGGTGELLEHLPLCESIDYVEKSRKMIHQAKNRQVNSAINFIQEDFLLFKTDEKYDVIICPFFLDCFNRYNLQNAIVKCKKFMKNKGRLVIVDFDNERTNQFLSKIMLWFFRLSTRLETRKLLNIRGSVLSSGFCEKQVKIFKKGIFNAVYVEANKK